MSGVIIPLTYQTLTEELGEKLSWEYIFKVGWFITCMIWITDITRTNFIWCRKNWPLQKYMRLKERKQITGSHYTFSSLYSATINSLLGDLSAALFGVAFGRETVNIRLGRERKKSAEGSIAMFTTCYLLGILMFWNLHLREYPVFFGALAATLTELYEPLYLNDNLTIPLISSLALTWGFHRIADHSGRHMLETSLMGTKKKNQQNYKE